MKQKILAALLAWFQGTSYYRLAHKDGYTSGYCDGRTDGISEGLRRVPEHTQQVMRNLEAASADRARLTRELAAARAFK